MALTRITKGVIKPNENYDTHNINSTGIVTAVGANFSGNVSVGGVLTYEDVTNIDSVGLITARNGIDCNGDLDVDGHTNLDNVSIVGVTTTTGNLNVTDGRILIAQSSAPQIRINSASNDSSASRFTFGIATGSNQFINNSVSNDGCITAPQEIKFGIGNNLKFRITNTYLIPNTDVIPNGNNVRSLGLSNYRWSDLYSVDANISGNLDVDGHTYLDNVSIAGVTTITGALDVINSSNTTIRIYDSTGTPDSFGSIGYNNGSDADDTLIIAVDGDNQQSNSHMRFYVDGLTSSAEKFRVDSDGVKVTGNIDANGDIDVDGHTNLDNVSIAGVTTITSQLFSGKVKISSDVNALSAPSVAGNYHLHLANPQNDAGETVGIAFGLSTGGDIGAAITHEREGSTSFGNLRFYTKESNSAASMLERMRITKEGKVGIGIVNPLKQLHVLGTGEVARFQSTNSVSSIRLYSTASGYSEIGHTGDLYFGTGNGDEKLRIQGSTGNVGIGTNNPGSKLDVLGDIRVSSKIELRALPAGSFLDFDDDNNPTPFPTATNNVTLASISGMNLIYDTNNNDMNGFMIAHGNPNAGVSTAVLVIDADENVGIGTDNPHTPLHVYDATVNEVARFDSGDDTCYISFRDVNSSANSINTPLLGAKTDDMFFQTGGAERLRITSDGDIYTSGNAVRDDARLTIEKNKVGVSTAIHLHNSNSSGTASKISSSKGIILSADVENNTSADRSFIAFETDNTEKLRIGSDGVTTITGALDVINSANTTIKLYDSTGNPDSFGSIGYNNGSDADDALVIAVDGDNQQSNSHMRFYVDGLTSSAEKMRITSDGVRIGAGNPVSKLQVDGDIYFNNNALISNFDANGVGGTNIDHIWHSDASNYGRGGTWNFVSDGAFKSAGNSAIQIGYLSCSGGAHFAANNVAIGLTTVSRGPLHVHENSGEDCQIHMTNNETGTTSSDGLTIFTDTDISGIWSREDVPFDIATAGTRSIRLHNTGGLSINTTSKSTSALLHIDNHGERNTNSDVGNSSQYVIVNDCHFGGSGGSLSANRSKAGMRNDVEFTSTTTSSTATGSRFSVYGIYNDINATKFAYVNDGIYSFVKSTADNQPSSSGTTTLRGVYGYSQGYLTNSQGNVNIHGGYFLGYRGGDVNAGHCYGVYARAHNTNGTSNTGDLTGVYSEWEQDDASTITNAYCFRGYGDRDAGTITNGYILNGSFGGDGGITNRYGVYIGDSNKNRLGGELTVTGDLVVNGSSKQFRIPHPIVGLSTTKDLVHAAIEGPQIDLIYRGKVDLVNGTATVNLDTKSRMTEGTFVLLNRDVQCFTTNETGWTNVKGSVTGNQLTIIAQENTCTDTISWMVIGERQDDAVKQSTSTNDNGKLIMEPLKEILPDADFEQPECEKNIYNEE